MGGFKNGRPKINSMKFKFIMTDLSDSCNIFVSNYVHWAVGGFYNFTVTIYCILYRYLKAFYLPHFIIAFKQNFNILNN